MFDEKSEISETLEWMLQSRQVGDNVLVRTLVQEEYSELYRLGVVVLNGADDRLVHDLTEQVICAVVDRAQDYSQEVSVRVLLFRIAIGIYQNSLGKGRSKLIGNRPILGEEPSLGRERNFWELFNTLSDTSRLIILLSCLSGFSDEEIAEIINLPASTIENNIMLVAERHSLQSDETETRPFSIIEIERILSERWPSKMLSEADKNLIAEKILCTLQEKDRRKHRLVILGEILLVVIAVSIVIGTGNVISDLTPDPTSQKVYQTELVNQIIYVSPTPAPTKPPTPFPDIAVIYRAEGGETLYDIADRLTYNATILEALNNIPAGQPLEAGQRVMIGIHEAKAILPTVVADMNDQTASFQTKELLNLRSNEGEIRQRILESRSSWSSLWADALVIQYGPPGYVGEPEMRRQQIWIQQPNFSYLLDGENGGKVEYIYSSMGGYVTFLNIQTRERLTSIISEQINYDPFLQRMLLPSELRENFSGEIEVLKKDMVAGREVLILDWYQIPDSSQEQDSEFIDTRIHRGRYWVDTTLGLILRRQTFNGNDVTQMLEEIIVVNLELHPNIPSRLFDLGQTPQTYFAKDFRGDLDLQTLSIPPHVSSSQLGREFVNLESPPQDFASNESYLTFKWTNLESFNPEESTQVSLFADSYFLGNIEFVEPNQIKCTRSPDGNLIAFSGWSGEEPFGYTPLRWFSLSDLASINEFMPDIVPYDFVFSPDSRQLAVYGCSRDDDPKCGVYLVDTLSGLTRILTAVEQGSGLLWNPDSSEIAIQGSFLRNGKWRVIVFNVDTGYTVFDGPFDWEGFWVAPESPIHDWGVPYPPSRGGLEICSPPPASG